MPHRVAAAQQAEDRRRERHLQRDEQQADDGGKEQGAREHGALLDRVAGAERLRRERHRAHAQEAEQPEEGVEHQRGHRDAAEEVRLAEPPDRRGADDAEQRRRQVGEHRRPGDGEDAGVGDDRWASGRCGHQSVSFSALWRAHEPHDQPDRHDDRRRRAGDSATASARRRSPCPRCAGHSVRRLSKMFQGSSPSTSRMTPIRIDSSTSRKITDSGGPPKKRATVARRSPVGVDGRPLVGMLMTSSYHVARFAAASHRARSRSSPACARASPAGRPRAAACPSAAG